MPKPTPATIDRWLTGLEARHLADLRLPEVTRALRALSSSYVERRHTITRGGALDSAGKRAAFALFYAPLHFLVVHHVIASLDTNEHIPSTILDIGCGTGAAGAAWAVLGDCAASVTGIDRHPWAVEEARWTYRTLGIRGTSRRGDAQRLPVVRKGGAVIAAYVLNELSDSARVAAEHYLFDAAVRGIRVLILEPIARGVAPWWSDTARRAVDAGGRSDEWRVSVDLPPLVQTLDRAAGLDHRELTARSIWLPGDV